MSKKSLNIFCLLITIFTLSLGCFLGTAKGQNVPNPPAQIYDRMGIYNWNGDPTGIPGYNTTFGLPPWFGGGYQVDPSAPNEVTGYTGITNLIASLKTRTIKIAIGANKWNGASSGTVATQSSSADASRANDGTTDGDISQNSVSQTAGGMNPWWQVDLGQSRPMRLINLWNRTDASASWLSNFYVIVSDQPIAQDLTTAINQSGAWKYYNAGTASLKTSILVDYDANGNARTGRYVKVWLNRPSTTNTTPLSLAEVEVFASPMVNAQKEPLKSTLSDPRFNTIIVVWNDTQQSEWVKHREGQNTLPLPPPDYNDAYQQGAELANYLTGMTGGAYNFPNKTFIFTNWEADSLMRYYTEDPSFLPAGHAKFEDYWAEALKYYHEFGQS